MRIPTSNSCVGVLVIFLCLFLFLFCGSAQAAITYSSYGNYIQVKDMPYANLTTIANEVNNISVINNTENGVWELNASIFSQNSTVYINNSDCSELRICGTDRYGRTLYGYLSNDIYIIHDVNITGWNSTSESPVMRNGPEFHSSQIYNTSFYSIGTTQVLDNALGDFYNISTERCYKLYFYNLTNARIYDIYAHDLYPDKQYNAIEIINTVNTVAHNISAKNTTRGEGIRIYNSTNGVYTNLRAENVGSYLGDYSVSYLHPQTGSEGIVLSGGNNNTASDIFINNTGWSGLCPSSGENGTRLKNITVLYAGHNSLDIHPAFNISVENATFTESVAYNILITYGDGSVGYPRDILLKDVICYDAGSFMNVRCKNITFDNVTYNGEGYSSKGNNDMYVINSTTNTPPGYSTSVNYIDFEKYVSTEGYANESYNSYVIDCDTYGLYSYLTYNYRAINTQFDHIFSSNDLGIYQYLDMVVVNETGSRINGATVNFTNEQNVSKTSCDRLGNNKTYFTTSNGRTYLPLENYTESPAILQTWYTTTIASRIDYTHTADVSTSHGNVTLTNITPDSTWRRDSQNTPHYTITAIVNDSTATHLTGYTPSNDYNAYLEGDKIKFQVWTSEPVDFIQWEEGGVTVASDTLTYETTVKDAPIVVNLFADDDNGSFSKEWVVASAVDLPNTNFTANVTTGNYPLRVLFTDNTSDNPAYWKWDFDNDGVIDSTAQNPVYVYKNPGNYTVTLTVENSLGEISQTETSYIHVTGTTPRRSITHTAWGYIYNIFNRLFYGLGSWSA